MSYIGKHYTYLVDVKFVGCSKIEVFDIEADNAIEARTEGKKKAKAMFPHRKIYYARPNYREINDGNQILAH